MAVNEWGKWGKWTSCTISIQWRHVALSRFPAPPGMSPAWGFWENDPMRYRPFRKTRRAAVAVQVALTLTVLMGLLAIVVDGGLLLAQRRQQQAAADSAALANGAGNDGTKSLITTNKTDAGGNPVHGIWNPPISGNFKTKTGYVEVMVEYD